VAAARILVVGAGIAGLAAARTLTRAGFSVDAVERQPAWDKAGTGIYLPGNAARALRALGLDFLGAGASALTWSGLTLCPRSAGRG
jgi:2-polyprenyl-6-methoxyphenol hydroxylase-like FAD-dependent oxidoreductase